MPIPTFNDFIAQEPKYKKFANSNNARNLYDYFRAPENIEKMIAANNNGRPALYGVQGYIELNFAGFSDFDFTEGFAKQCAGSMIRCILEPLGFKPFLQRDLPKKESKYFTSAMYYSYDPKSATCKLIKKIEIQEIS